MDFNTLTEAYETYVLTNNERPKSVWKFCKDQSIEESDFYNFAASFKDIEARILKHIVENAIDLTQSALNAVESEATAREHMLTFYLTLTEVMKVNRSLLVFILPTNPHEWKKIAVFKEAKQSFNAYVTSLPITLNFMDFIPSDSIKHKTLQTSAWMQFMSILHYWIKDTSPGFEKTDIYIEKSLKFSFDLVESNTLNNLADLGKFLMNKQ